MMFLHDELLTREQLEEHRAEIENRIRSLFWTVSGDHSLDIRPDVETFAVSRPMALYEAVKQGAFARHFDQQALALYTLKKLTSGADEKLLMALVQLCVDAAAYPRAAEERCGVPQIRKEAFEDFLRLDWEQPTGRREKDLHAVRCSLICRFLGRTDSCPDTLRPLADAIAELSQIPDTDALIASIDSLYNVWLDDGAAQSRGGLQAVLSVSEEELIAYRHQELRDEQMKAVLDEYLSALKQEMLRMNRPKAKPSQRLTPEPPIQTDEAEPKPEALEKVAAYIERNFGKSCLTPLEQERICRQHCKGIHSRCTLYFTDGILSNPALKNTQYLRGQMQSMKNELYFRGKERAVRKSVAVLGGILKRVQIMRLDEDSSRSDFGQINPARLWKVGRSTDSKLFDVKKKREESSFVVDILLDGSSSQIIRQPQIATQAYIISQSLSEAGIPHRVSSFCSYWDYTILHRFRNYDDPAERSRNILQFSAFGENRDGLAIGTVCASLEQRNEENKILIILSDGRPNNLNVGRAGSRKPMPYIGEAAVKDTAFAVRKARNRGICVLGIFVGSEEDLAAEKRIFGKDFTYTRTISSFSHIVGAYLRKLMEQD